VNHIVEFGFGFRSHVSIYKHLHPIRSGKRGSLMAKKAVLVVRLVEESIERADEEIEREISEELSEGLPKIP
jgi:hypothetical protein